MILNVKINNEKMVPTVQALRELANRLENGEYVLNHTTSLHIKNDTYGSDIVGSFRIDYNRDELTPIESE